MRAELQSLQEAVAAEEAGGSELLAQIASDLWGTQSPEIPQGAALVDIVVGHYEATLGFYGAELGRRVARKHLGWYMDHAGTGPAMRLDGFLRAET